MTNTRSSASCRTPYQQCPPETPFFQTSNAAKLRLLLLLSLFLALSCVPNRQGQQNSSSELPNILLIVSEDNGPELGCYGTTEVTTPHLDALAREGVKFENAFVTYSVCSPSRSTIYTGLYPHQNGQIGLATHKYRMYESYKTLPVFLKEAGYRTGCLGKIHVNPESAIPWDYHSIKSSNFAKKNLPDYARKGAEFARESGEAPFFLMVNFPDAHCDWQKQVEGMPAHPLDGEDIERSIPFIGVDNERLRELTANYYNSINRLDESVGMLMDSLRTSGALENTLIIYLGDHGAQFSRGKTSNYEAGLRVPFIVSWPGKVPEGREESTMISTIDLLPTLLSAASIPVPDHLPGQSLFPLIQNGALERPRNYIFAGGAGSAAFYHYPRRSVRNERFKLIHNLLHERENPKFMAYAFQMYGTGTLPSELEGAPDHIVRAYATWQNPPEYELYDLQADPYEFSDLSAEEAYAAQLAELQTALHEWQIETRDPFYHPEMLARITAEADSVNQHYPGRNYNKDPDFQWKYPDYFSAYRTQQAGQQTKQTTNQ